LSVQLIFNLKGSIVRKIILSFSEKLFHIHFNKWVYSSLFIFLLLLNTNAYASFGDEEWFVFTNNTNSAINISFSDKDRTKGLHDVFLAAGAKADFSYSMKDYRAKPYEIAVNVSDKDGMIFTYHILGNSNWDSLKFNHVHFYRVTNTAKYVGYDNGQGLAYTFFNDDDGSFEKRSSIGPFYRYRSEVELRDRNTILAKVRQVPSKFISQPRINTFMGDQAINTVSYTPIYFEIEKATQPKYLFSISNGKDVATQAIGFYIQDRDKRCEYYGTSVTGSAIFQSCSQKVGLESFEIETALFDHGDQAVRHFQLATNSLDTKYKIRNPSIAGIYDMYSGATLLMGNPPISRKYPAVHYKFELRTNDETSSASSEFDIDLNACVAHTNALTANQTLQTCLEEIDPNNYQFTTTISNRYKFTTNAMSRHLKFIPISIGGIASGNHEFESDDLIIMNPDPIQYFKFAFNVCPTSGDPHLCVTENLILHLGDTSFYYKEIVDKNQEKYRIVVFMNYVKGAYTIYLYQLDEPALSTKSLVTRPIQQTGLKFW
jgi:hypothetical protein